MKLLQLFEPEPVQWGLRGDPFLWRELRERLGDLSLPESASALREILEDSFQTLTGQSLGNPETVRIPRFSHGGMSSGCVSPPFWTDTAIPLLLARYAEAGRASHS